MGIEIDGEWKTSSCNGRILPDWRENKRLQPKVSSVGDSLENLQGEPKSGGTLY